MSDYPTSNLFNAMQLREFCVSILYVHQQEREKTKCHSCKYHVFIGVRQGRLCMENCVLQCETTGVIVRTSAHLIMKMCDLYGSKVSIAKTLDTVHTNWLIHILLYGKLSVHVYCHLQMQHENLEFVHIFANGYRYLNIFSIQILVTCQYQHQLI